MAVQETFLTLWRDVEVKNQQLDYIFGNLNSTEIA